MSNKNNSGGNGVGFWGLLLIVFIVLKLTDTIDWSWWMVLSPIWVYSLILGVILFIYRKQIR